MNIYHRPLRTVAALAAGALVFATLEAHAGQSCEPFTPTARTVAQSLELAQQVQSELDASGAEVALVARSGQNLSRWHLRYSHMAIAWRDDPAGRWSVRHELNECASDHSSLYVQGLGDFFLDDMYTHQALIIVPSAALQRRLIAEITSDDLTRLHEPHYNTVAYPFSTEFQNSNGWILELLAASLAEPGTIHDRAAAQQYLLREHFQPTTLDIPMLDRLGADLMRANTSFNDHPFDRRMAGQIDCVTVDSIAHFVKAQDSAATFRENRLP